MALDFIAGCVGGCAGVIVGHPLDTVKVRLQTQDAVNPRYRGTWHCLSETVRKESVRGLYKGMSSPIAGVSAINAVIFGVHANVTKRFKDPDSLRANAYGGAAAGFVQAFIASPVELAKTRMQLQPTGPGLALYKGPLDCIRKIAQKEGFKGIFRGQGITIAREIPGFTSYFYTYSFLTNKLGGDDPSAPVILFSGGLAGTASWILTFPIDVLKSRIQADGMIGIKYNGVYDCLKKSIASEGISCMGRGLTSTIVRSFPTNAATFYAVNLVTKMFQTEESLEMDAHAWENVINRGEILLSKTFTENLMPKLTFPKNLLKIQIRSVLFPGLYMQEISPDYEDERFQLM